MNQFVWVLVVLLILGAVGALPSFGHHSYGYYPTGGLGLLLIIVIFLLLFRA